MPQTDSRSGYHSTSLPPIPVFERQVLPAHTLVELRRACALILKDTSPSDAELNTIVNQPDPLATYERDIAKVRAQAAATQPTSFLPIKTARYQDRRSARDGTASTNRSSSTLPLSFHRLSSSASKAPNALSSSELRPEAHAPINSNATTRLKHKPIQVKEEAALASIHIAISSRPKTSAAARIDFKAPSADSSASSARSNTTLGRRISTGMTSFAQTPAEEKRVSSQLPPRTSSHNGSMHTRTTQDPNQKMRERDLAAPNPDYSIPTLHHPRSSSRQSAGQSSRPRSRASSIKDNILGGIRDYMQPRSSMERPRGQSRAESCSSSRPESRASSVALVSHGWLRSAAGGVRRKGSWNSFRSNRFDEEESERGRTRGKGPDLNRRLPPLPGLDQYKAPKLHIAQLMACPPLEHDSSMRDDLPSPPHHVTSLGNNSPIPHNQVQPHPRIPFSDDQQGDNNPGHIDQLNRTLPATENSQRDLELRRQTHKNNAVASEQNSSPDKHGGSMAEDYAMRRDLELRRPVRENMTQGASSGEERYEKEEDEFKRMARAKAKGLHAHNRYEATARDYALDEGKEREWKRRLEREAARSGTQGAHKRRQQERLHADKERERREKRWEQVKIKAPAESEGPKKTLKNRFSRFLGGSGGAA